MTLAEMQTYLASLVDDPQQTYFTPAQTLLYINHAQQETQKLLIQAGQNFFLKSATFATVANGASYALPSDHMKTNRLEYVQGSIPNEYVSALSSITLNQQSQFSRYAQFPSCFYFFGRNAFILVPVPQTVCNMVHTYTYRIPDLAISTDVSEIPLEFHPYVVHRAAIECFIKDQRDISTLVNYTSKVEEDLKREAVERAQDRAPTIVRTSEDTWGWG